MSEKHKYWTELDSTRHQFFKIMTGNFEDRLRIPRKFVANFREELPETIGLRGPSGHVWAAKLTRSTDDWLLQNGWNKFVQDHDLQGGDLLIFRYEGKPCFKVTIFCETACEREGAYFIEQHTRSCAKYCCENTEEDHNPAEDVIRLDVVEEKDRHKAKRKAAGKRIQIGADLIHEEPHEKKGFKNKKMETTNPGASKRRGTEYVDQVETFGMSETSGEGASANSEDANEDTGHKQRKGNHETEGAEERRQNLSTYSLYLVSNRRKVTEEEVQRAIRRAQKHQPTQPYKTVVMKPTNVYKHFSVRISKKWARAHMPPINDLEVELRVPPSKKKWNVQWKCSTWRAGFCKGWFKFVKENNLEEDDVCIFELKQGGKTSKKTPVFDVNIFRVVDEIVPLTPTRGLPIPKALSW